MNIKDKLKTARRAEKVVAVCLRGDLAAEVEQIRERLSDLPVNESLAGNPERAELLARLAEVRDEMVESTVDFRLQALTRAGWTALVVAHPPRENVERDRRLGINEDAFLAKLIRECLVDPELDTDDWDTLEETLSHSQYSELANAAWELNQQVVSVPFLPAGLLSQVTSEAA